MTTGSILRVICFFIHHQIMLSLLLFADIIKDMDMAVTEEENQDEQRFNHGKISVDTARLRLLRKEGDAVGRYLLRRCKGDDIVTYVTKKGLSRPQTRSPWTSQTCSQWTPRTLRTMPSCRWRLLNPLRRSPGSRCRRAALPAARWRTSATPWTRIRLHRRLLQIIMTCQSSPSPRS